MPVNPKASLIEQLQKLLSAELAVLLQSAASAREAATHAENKPENKYDTRGLEASYLAGAQAERAQELQRDIQILTAIPLKSFGEGDRITATALVTVIRNNQEFHYFFMPLGAGAQLHDNGQTITVVTPSSPIGRACLGKQAGDLVHLKEGHSDLEITAVW